jgi:hypothetical protein
VTVVYGNQTETAQLGFLPAEMLAHMLLRGMKFERQQTKQNTLGEAGIQRGHRDGQDGGPQPSTPGAWGRPGRQPRSQPTLQHDVPSAEAYPSAKP